MFNLRVYGVLINEKKEVLVSDELIRGQYITKFPGGGLEYGEGTKDCLRREWMEELQLQIEVGEHIYTTDYFQESAFRAGDQIISIYYKVNALEPIKVPIRMQPFDFDDSQMKTYESTQEIESFRFIDSTVFSEKELTLPIDKIVAKIILKKY
ncbi:MAG: NUDIX hydrolase [Chitinophagaceae bacterium]|nr:NUDIX hydrolase [Chitinophagaceae bacterium]MCB0739776.1 NUDIX hydrolase [Chitinophagaceae bacterium]HQU55931.1 NUDIX hydrolase [Chitinophagaceae bacterium]HQV05328.1 NUDIX hydrolase [Chitinophagaceae bacterium]